MALFQASLQFYAQNIRQLLLLSVLAVFPPLLLYNIIMNYLNLLTTITGVKLVSGFVNMFLLLLIFTVIQLPFAQFVQNRLDGEERPLGKALYAFAEHGFTIFLFGIAYALAVTTGMLLLVIPGLILFILFYVTPYLMVIKQQSAWKCWRAVVEMGKTHFFKILGLILAVSISQFGVSMLGIWLLTLVTTSYGVGFFTQLLLNVVLFPFIAVLFSMYTREHAPRKDLNRMGIPGDIF
ncbi:hypothetical protein NDK47_26860 [Brevibacillus ruminantium]|uniref:Glycerophosphoryl diester phosphodiesterase membrane domain-containing protein n=1 Tax=Brevibacillus ruminantium TaxID=2950604 RepID=A0ABY4WEU4_9BACL|nr:hypothetical protein [Brevibacillus ruminantium]USG65676.1 hypothetical protein NDK47_26860 [Brevibacillus ruminantium]